MLRPDRLFVLDSGLWALDVRQPVAAVLDPVTGALHQLVSWRELPPARAGLQWPGPRVLADGVCLWAQQEPVGPLVRIGLGGVAVAAWTDGLLLAACGPEVAWCAPAPPDQELVAGPDPLPVRTAGGGRLLKVSADGTCTTVRTEQPVRSVQPDAQGLLVEVELAGWTLRHLGADLHEVLRPTRWLRLAWDARPPGTLTVAEHGLPPDFRAGERTDGGGHAHFGWYQEPPPFGNDDAGSARSGLRMLGLSWHLGWAPGSSGSGSNAIATAHGLDGQEVGRWDLGPGTVLSVAALRDRVAVAISRQAGPSAGTPPGAEVLALDPVSKQAVALLTAETLDVTGACWPVSDRPLDADSYLTQVFAGNSALGAYWLDPPGGDETSQAQPLARGMSQVRAALIGDWPDTKLEWTFAFAPYPGLVMRRRVPLFDELGRPDLPQHADIHLMEDLDTRNLPPADQARDGVLDI